MTGFGMWGTPQLGDDVICPRSTLCVAGRYPPDPSPVIKIKALVSDYRNKILYYNSISLALYSTGEHFKGVGLSREHARTDYILYFECTVGCFG